MMIPTKPEGVTWTDEQWKAIYLSGMNIIVSAGAGSGKTAVLTERIIEKIKSGISINDMIILTFTNAAAAEMRARVRKKIIKAVEDNPNLKEQVYLIDQAPITTYDAYSLSLLKKYHYLLGICNNIGIIDNAVLTTIIKDKINNIFEEEYNNEDFLRFLNIYTEKDDESIKRSIIQIYNQINSICKKREYLENYIETFYNEEYIDKNINEYINLIKDTSNTILTIFECMKGIVTDDKLTEFLLKIEEGLENLSYAKTYDDYKKIVSNINKPTFPRKVDDEEEKESLKNYYEKFKSYFDDLEELLSYDSEIDMKEEILSTKESAEVIIRILKKLDNEVLDYKMTNNVYEFSDITRLSIELLETYPEIRDSIKNNTHEIMIDEYQDTNDINDYFISLISNNNVYMVGDVKQSIYRFRNANPRIFMEKYNNYKKHIGGEALDLTKNFRSREEVLSNINELFNHIMDEEIGGANYTDGHNMIYGNKIYSNKAHTEQNYNMELYNYSYKDTESEKEYSKDEIEAFIIADDIKNRIKSKELIWNMDDKEFHDTRYSDYVILLDRKSNFELYKKVFDYKGIPLIMHKDEEFAYANEIYVLKNILKLIYYIRENNYEKFNYSFISVTRSYLFDFNDNDIFTSVTNKDIFTNEIFKDLTLKLKYLADKSKRESISNLILDIYKEFDFYMKSVNITNVENINKKLDYIYDISCNLDNLGYTLKDFITYFDNIFENKLDIQFSNKKDTSSNSVNIMTIHNSKGLEFPVCYFPNLYKAFNQDDLKERFLYDKKYGLIMPVFDEGLKETIYKRLVKENYLKEDISERLRVFYVALTRAKEKMIMINPILEKGESLLPFENDVVNKLERTKYNSFEAIMTSLKSILSPYIKSVSYNVNKDYNQKKDYDYKNNLEKENFIYETETLNIEREVKEEKSFSHTRTKIEKIDSEEGLNLHEILEYLDFNNYKNDINKYDLSDSLKELLFKLFDMPFMKDISNAKIYKEFEFYQNDKKGIMDLLLEFEDKFIIVDYKLKNIDKTYYTEQINGYASYLKEVSSKKVEGYLYSIINSTYKRVL